MNSSEKKNAAVLRQATPYMQMTKVSNDLQFIVIHLQEI